MIQLNLLPDVKLEYIHAQRLRRLMVTVSVLISVASVGILILLFLYGLTQKNQLHNAQRDINKYSSELKNKKDISKVLTVQNQLSELSTLHAAKPATTKVFSYLNQITPDKVSISHFSIDYVGQKISISGDADSIVTVNKYVDTLKYTNYMIDGDSTKTKAFKDVVLDSFSAGTGQTGNTTTYTVSFTYEPVIFDNAQNIKLDVPAITTTRAALENPTDLFKASSANTSKGSN
jgi:Tfp pilus assembly protein PilN